MYKQKGLMVRKAAFGLSATSGSPNPGTKSSAPLLTDDSTWKAGSEKYGKPYAAQAAKNWDQGKTFARYSTYAQPLDSALQANHPRFAEAKKAIQSVNPDDIAGRNAVVDSLKKAGHTYALTPEQEKASLAQFGEGAFEEFQATRREALAGRPSNVLGANESGADVSQSRWGIGNSAAAAPPVAKYTDSYDDKAGNIYPRAQYSTNIGYSPKQKTYSYQTKADTVYPVPAKRTERFAGITATRKHGGLMRWKETQR